MLVGVLTAFSGSRYGCWSAAKSRPPSLRWRSIATPALALLLHRDLLLLLLVNVLWMGAYSLWSQWTTLYLIHVHGLTLLETRAYTWIPPLVSNVGGFLGGWLSLRWMERGAGAITARRRAIWVSAAGLLFTLLLPWMHTATGATTIISVSFLFALAGSVNIYALPIDLFGPERSGLAISALTFAYGLLQTVISPVIGDLGDRHLYNEVVWGVTLLPLLSCVVLLGIRENRLSASTS